MKINRWIRTFLVLALTISILGTIPMVWASAAVTASGTCGADLTWALDSEGTLTISGIGEMDHYQQKGEPWYSHASSIRKVVVEPGVTSIGEYAFSYCSALTEVRLPEGLTAIGEAAFYKCTQLTDIVIPGSLKTISDYAFSYCGFTALAIPEGVTSIAAYAFFGCKEMTCVTIPVSMKSIGLCAFYNCTQLWHVLYRGTEAEWKQVYVASQDSYYQDAIRHYECVGDEVTDPVNKRCALCCDHSFGDGVVVPPTCTERGYTSRTCAHCGYVQKDDYTSETGHSYGDWIVDKAPTDTEEGSKHRICGLCGREETERIPISRWGDANGDGSINYLDAYLVMHCAVGSIGHNDLNWDMSDVNGDGSVNYMDAYLIMRRSVDQIDKFPVEEIE